jgi:hypothetical protein
MKKQIPNCDLCLWRKEIYYIIIGNRSCCSAQAGRLAETVYNNKLCQKLFKEKD